MEVHQLYVTNFFGYWLKLRKGAENTGWVFKDPDSQIATTVFAFSEFTEWEPWIHKSNLPELTRSWDGCCDEGRDQLRLTVAFSLLSGFFIDFLNRGLLVGYIIFFSFLVNVMNFSKAFIGGLLFKDGLNIRG